MDINEGKKPGQRIKREGGREKEEERTVCYRYSVYTIVLLMPINWRYQNLYGSEDTRVYAFLIILKRIREIYDDYSWSNAFCTTTQGCRLRRIYISPLSINVILLIRINWTSRTRSFACGVWTIYARTS